jgi:hypothetical protein
MDNNQTKRRHTREPYTIALEFTVLLTQSTELKRIVARGETVDKSPAGIGLITDFPLEAGHVLEWDDQHNRGNLHIALVKWARHIEGSYRAGLIFI